jgi:hypothetical protein
MLAAGACQFRRVLTSSWAIKGSLFQAALFVFSLALNQETAGCNGGRLRAAWNDSESSPPGTLVMSAGGGAVILFTDVSAIPRPMQWTMTFDGKGKLLKAMHAAAPKSREKVVQRTSVEVQGKPVQQRR